MNSAAKPEDSKSATSARPNSEAELRREIEALRQDMSALTKRFGKIGDAGVKTAKDYGRDTRDAAYETGEALYEDAVARISDLERQTVRSIRENPLQAVGIAAGIGFLAALLTRR